LPKDHFTLSRGLGIIVFIAERFALCERVSRKSPVSRSKKYISLYGIQARMPKWAMAGAVGWGLLEVEQ
jgi:hypothetical protein